MAKIVTPKDHWQRIATRVRNAIENHIPDMEKMDSTGLMNFVSAARDALWFEVNAETFEDNVEKARNEKPWDNP